MATLESRRRMAKKWCEFAVNGHQGRLLSDPVYQHIVERRDQGPYYSSCGDLGHWILWTLGCREGWVNRADNKGGWRRGKNISLLAFNKYARTNIDPTELETGDVCIIWSRPDTTDAHVFVFDRFSEGEVYSWDFGQGPMSSDRWKNQEHLEAKRRVRKLNKIQKVVSLADIPYTEEPYIPSGEAFDAMESFPQSSHGR